MKFLVNENWISQSKLCVESVVEETTKFRKFEKLLLLQLIWKSD